MSSTINPIDNGNAIPSSPNTSVIFGHVIALQLH